LNDEGEKTLRTIVIDENIMRSCEERTVRRGFWTLSNKNIEWVGLLYKGTTIFIWRCYEKVTNR
jgi:hypothetical protein